MKKLVLTVFFNFLFSSSLLAKTSDEVRKCWECNLIEGIYTYTFNFVFKMYKVLAPIIYDIALVLLLFSILWLIYKKVIKGDTGDFWDLAKDFFLKIFAMIFVWAMLLQVSAGEIFSYTINPIMNFGSGFGSWILKETRADNEIMSYYKVPMNNCEDIKISKNTSDMINQNAANDDDAEMMEATIRDLVCITNEYSNSYTVGINLGFKLMVKGLKEFSVAKISEKVNNFIENIMQFTPYKGFAIAIYIILQIFIYISYGITLLVVILGFGIATAFLYVAFTFLMAMLDIVIKLAMVGVMMPITIGSWAFSGKDIYNLRGKLSSQLFWSVLQSSFRLIFIAIAMSITTFLLSELMTTTFDTGNSIVSVKSIYDSLDYKTGVEILHLFVSNTGMFVAILISTMVVWLLIGESISMADSFSSALFKGTSDANILNGFKQLTFSTIETIFSVSHQVANNYRAENKLKNAFEKNNQVARDKDIVNVINKYRNQKNNDDDTIIPSQSVSQSTLKNIKTNIDELNTKLSKQTQSVSDFVKDKFDNIPEYKNLSTEKQEIISDFIYMDNANKSSGANDTEIRTFIAALEKSPDIYFPKTSSDVNKSSLPTINKIREEYIKTEVLKKFTPNYLKKNRQIKEVFVNAYKNNDIKELNRLRQSMPTDYKIFIKEVNKLTDNVKLDLKKKRDTIYNLRGEIKSIHSKYKGKLDIHNEKLTAKNVIMLIKEAELEDYKKELSEINILTSPIKFAYLRKKIKKLTNEYDDIKESDNYELEDMVDDIIDNFEKQQKRKKRSGIKSRFDTLFNK